MSVKAKIIYGMMRALGSLPLGFHYFWADVIAWFLKKVLRYRYDVVFVNLARSFPELKYHELKRIADDFYTHLGEIFVEAIWFAGCWHKPDRLRRARIVEIANQEVLNEAFEKAPSVTTFTSHCGNWEIMGGICYYNFNPAVETLPQEKMYVTYKRLTNKLSDEIFYINRGAPMHDYKGMLESEQILRFTIRHKNEKLAYFIIGDQCPYGSNTDAGIFLNQQTKSIVGTFALAQKFGHAVLYASYDRVARGKYKITFRKLCDDASKCTAQELMTEYYRLLEEDIRKNPANWLWSHKRWK